MDFKKFLIDLANKSKDRDYTDKENIFFTLTGSATIMVILWVLWFLSLGMFKTIFGILMILNCIPLANLIYKFSKLQ